MSEYVLIMSKTKMNHQHSKNKNTETHTRSIKKSNVANQMLAGSNVTLTKSNVTLTESNINVTESKINTTKSKSTSDHVDKKLPLKSIHGRRCLTKCYPKGKYLLHPIFLQTFSGLEHDICAIDPIYLKGSAKDEDPLQFGLDIVDKCNMEDNEKYQEPDELRNLLLTFNFDPVTFLANIYNLKSFDDVIYWTLENDHLPFDTIKRVHNCAWRIFGNDLQKISTNVYEYYRELTLVKWIKDFVKEIEKNYEFNIILENRTNELDNKNNSISDSKQLKDFIIKNFLRYDDFEALIKKFVKDNQKDWDSIESYYGNLKNYIYRYVVKKLNK
jgi:hypothetical protein